MKKYLFLPLAMFALMFSACGSDDVAGTGEEPGGGGTEEVKTPIMISTRAEDNSFQDGDKIGLYVVNYANGASLQLGNSGNHINNMAFTYTGGVWSGSTPIYWKDLSTRADFYAYYPYSASVSSVSGHNVVVKSDQSEESAYVASDFLWGKTAAQSPTTSNVSLLLNHRMSRAIITVRAGEGFYQTDLENGSINVMINGVKNSATVNLRDGSVSATGNATSVIPCKTAPCQYKAIIVPQTVSSTNLVIVNFNGIDYYLAKDMKFESNQQYEFTVTLGKLSSGINVGVGPWENDGEDHGGVLE